MEENSLLRGTSSQGEFLPTRLWSQRRKEAPWQQATTTMVRKNYAVKASGSGFHLIAETRVRNQRGRFRQYQLYEICLTPHSCLLEDAFQICSRGFLCDVAVQCGIFNRPAARNGLRDDGLDRCQAEQVDQAFNRRRRNASRYSKHYRNTSLTKGP